MRFASTVLLLLAVSSPALADDANDAVAALAKQLRELDSRVLPKDVDYSRMLSNDIRKRIQEANERETAAWRAIKTKEQWERYRDAKIEALRYSLSLPDGPRGRPKTHVTGTIKGDGYFIENLVFESRPGLWMTANLYQPAKQRPAMEGIILCHSHHAPKWQGELQDMGITWARQGCAVLVMDQLGHGERRQHPFVDEKSYAGKFRVSRQDYYFRYNVALQLELVGESLMGWMVCDLMRGVDLLCSISSVDDKSILLLGSVAGGGDPAAVAAALDPRIKCVAPFNFGGPQPETTFPLPADPEKAFNYAGSGSWESTRNLRNSVRDGFLPWVIVGAAAPRYLVYAHEFAWDREHDPVWRRFETIYSFYEADDNLDFAHGRGKVTGQPPEATHCTNIGPEHRKQIYQSFWDWFEIPIPKNDRPERRTVQELTCLSPELIASLKPKTVRELALQSAHKYGSGGYWNRGATFRLAESKALRELGALKLADIDVRRFVMTPERDIVVPFLLLIPSQSKPPYPVTICVAQAGKDRFLRGRSEGIGELLRAGIAVCLPDLRGCGETSPGDLRGRQSSATGLSSSEQMLGQSLFQVRLRDFYNVVKSLAKQKQIDAERVAVWGDSFAPVNDPTQPLIVPLDAERMPCQSEPLGGLIALLGAEFSGLKAVCVRNGLADYRSLLDGPCFCVPHDAMLPNFLLSAELSTHAAALHPLPIWLEGLVDGLNRRLDKAKVQSAYRDSFENFYDKEKVVDKLRVEDHNDDCRPVARWLIEQLKAK